MLASQIGDLKRKVCFRCLAKERAEKGEPEISQNARKPGAMRARIDGESRESQEGKILKTEVAKEGVKMEQKVCGYCHKPKPASDFDASTRFPGKLKGSCRDCLERVKTAQSRRAARTEKSPSHKERSTPRPASPMARSEKRGEAVDGSRARVLGHSHQLLSIALLGPRPQDHDFVRALCARVLEDTILESKVPTLEGLG